METENQILREIDSSGTILDQRKINEIAKRVAGSITNREDREDVYVECLLTAEKIKHKVKSKNPCAFYHRAMTNTKIDYLRKLRPSISLVTDIADDSYSQWVRSSKLESRIAALMAILPLQDRILISLLKDYKISQIAKLYGVSINTMRVRICRQRQKWMRLLKSL